MADHPIRASGISRVPLGGRGVFSFTVRESGMEEDVTSVQFILKNHLGATIYDATRTVADVSGTATDGGATTITDEVGTGKYRVTYTPPNNGTYTPTSAGLQFSLRVVAVDEDGTADTGAIAFYVDPVAISIADTSSILERVRKRTGIMQEIFLHLKAGDEDVDLGVGGVYELPLVTKNGTVLTLTTHYTWSTYRSYITLVAPAADGDEVYVQAQRVISTDHILDVIDEAANMMVRPALLPLYDAADLVLSPTYDALLTAYTVGRLRQDLAKGASLEDPKYRSGLELINEVKRILDAIRSGSMGLAGTDGNEVPTREGVFVGAFLHPGGELTGRLKAVDRAQQWLGLIQNYWPEAAPEHVIDLRALA